MANRRLCQKIIEEHFELPFKRATLGRYKIDFYNWRLRIAVVYKSIHHCKYSPKFHKTYSKFVATCFRDREIEEFCRMNDITLITISYNAWCVLGIIRRKLGIPNDCRCLSCSIN